MMYPANQIKVGTARVYAAQIAAVERKIDSELAQVPSLIFNFIDCIMNEEEMGGRCLYSMNELLRKSDGSKDT